MQALHRYCTVLQKYGTLVQLGAAQDTCQMLREINWPTFYLVIKARGAKELAASIGIKDLLY